MEGTIEICNVTKKYGDVTALQGVSLSVGKGRLYGLIGPDGAGKTSLFRILATLSVPDEGEAFVDGRDVVKDYTVLRREIGYMPGHFALYQDLSVEENLEFYATIFGTTVAENYGTIKEIYSQIEPFRKRKAGKLSGGMKQKLALCCALVHKPSVLFLDEPTTGVDAVSRKDFWNMLKRIQASGVTILVSTPYMDEAGLCDEIALIQHGRIIDSGTPEQIVSKYPYTLLAVSGEPMFDLLKCLRTAEGVLSCFSFGSEHHVAIDRTKTDETALLRFISEKGFSGCSVREAVPGIEDCFMYLSSQKNDNSHV